MWRLSPIPPPPPPLKLPATPARVCGLELDDVVAAKAFALSVANIVAGQESAVDEVRALAHSRPQTMLTLVLALGGAVLGGLQLLGLWGVGGLGDWDWRGLCYVVPLAGAQPPNPELNSSELMS